jgi:putative PIN family toxin of toxin-antitoxin system
VTSEPILAEVERAWTKPYWRRRIAADRAALVLALLRRFAEVVPVSAHVYGIATHPEDDTVLATAISARAPYLVTGDKGLLGVGRFRGVAILTPRDFLNLLERIERERS